VRWLRTRSGELGIDTGRIVAGGESAGAHLAALVGLTAGRGGEPDGPVPAGAVVGVVDWYGPADLTTMGSQALPNALARADAPDSRESLLLGASPAAAPERARAASPVSYVHPGAPPFHIAHGTEDRFVPAAQSRQLADALRAAGVPVELALIPDSDHMWIDAPDPDAILDAAVDFARRTTGA
jgi:acetyl esterase/lipase